MKEKEREELKCVKIECPKCGSENMIAVKKLTDSSDPIRCSSCGEKIVVIGETMVVFEE